MKETVAATGNRVAEQMQEQEVKLEHSISTLALLAVLKQCTSKERPLTASKLAEKTQLMGIQMEEKTVFRKLTALYELFCELEGAQSPMKTELYHILLATCAGRVQREDREPKRRRKTRPQGGRQQYVFYFEPIFQKSEVKMINSSIISNQYLSEEERRYLLFCEYCLYGDERMENSALPGDLPAGSWSRLPKKGGSRRADANRRMLEIIDALYNAIEREQVVEVCYGRYGKGRNGRVELLADNRGRGPHVLNPYAMLWCNGQYYLIATYRGSDKPMHFRIDRILRADPWFDPAAGEIGRRSPIPESLKDFFVSRGGRKLFLAEKYIRTYPLMSIYGKEKIVRCRLSCHAMALSVVVDGFGREQAISVVGTERTQDGEERFLVQIEAQYESVLLFCLQQHRIVTAMEPRELVEDVIAGLNRPLKRYREL